MVRAFLSDDGPDEQHDLHNEFVAQHNQNVQYARAAERALAICTCTCSCGKRRINAGRASAAKQRRVAGTRDDPILILNE